MDKDKLKEDRRQVKNLYVSGVYRCLYNSDVDFFLMLFQTRFNEYFYKFVTVTSRDMFKVSI
jgi:hypothetical protein